MQTEYMSHQDTKKHETKPNKTETKQMDVHKKLNFTYDRL